MMMLLQYQTPDNCNVRSMHPLDKASPFQSVFPLGKHQHFETMINALALSFLFIWLCLTSTCKRKQNSIF